MNDVLIRTFIIHWDNKLYMNVRQADTLENCPDRVKAGNFYENGDIR